MKSRRWLLAVFFIYALWPLNVYGQVTNIKGVAKKADIILLQDESGSMKRTDPHHIRNHVATFLTEDLEVAGEGNRMALILFGSRTAERVGLSRDFKQIKKASKEGFSYEKGPFSRKSFAAVPPRGYTDIYGALEAALKMLKKEKKDEKATPSDTEAEKHVILLTDGEMDPWPGNEQRYGSLAADYLKCLSQSSYRRCDRRFKERAADMDRETLFDPAGLLATFRKNGWRVHCVGFSKGVDITLLKRISAATYGNADIATDYTQLLNILEQIIPPAPNVVTLLVRDFCETRRVEERVQIDSDIKAVQFKVDLNRMLAQQSSIRPENLKIVLIAPDGTEISSQDDKFRFNTTNKGLVVTATYFQEKPQPGTWRIIVEGVGSDICGKIGVTGRVPFVPEMSLTPEISSYYGGQGVGITVSLKSRDSNERVPVRRVEGKFRFSPEGGGSIHEEKIEFRVKDGQSGESVSFRIPEGVKGTAAIETTVTDGKYGSKAQQFRRIRVEPGPTEVEIAADPPQVSLGIVGDDSYEVTSEPISLTSSAQLPFEVIIKKPRLSSGAHEINILWVKVMPSSGTVSPGRPLKVRVRVALPKDASLALPRGVYKGDMEVSAKKLKGECIIPVDLEVEVPEVLVEPSSLDYDFWFRLGAPITNSIDFGHTSNRDRIVRLELPRFFKDSRGRYEKNIAVRVPNSSALEWTLDMGEMVEVPLEVSLKNLSLNKAQRIPKGRYHGKVRITGEGLNPREVDIRVAIPETPFVLKYGRPLGLIVTGFFGLLVLIGLALFVHRWKWRLFIGVHRIELDEAGSIKPKDMRRFECVFQRGADEEGEHVFSMPPGVNSPTKIMVEDPASGEMVPFPADGIPNIEDWEGEPLGRIKTGNYVYRNPRSKGRNVTLRVTESPYGTAAGYFFKKVLIWLLLGTLAGGAAYWFHQIV